MRSSRAVDFASSVQIQKYIHTDTSETSERTLLVGMQDTWRSQDRHCVNNSLHINKLYFISNLKRPRKKTLKATFCLFNF